jgi:ATP-independent RNA helicase DbpA
LNSTEFSSLPLSSDLLAVIRELGFEKLTPIQSESIPLLLQGKDLIGQSKTGSGKTAAFALPILQNIKTDQRQRDIQALILCPTRELSAQVAREMRKLARRHIGLQVLVLSGGQPLRPQMEALNKGVHIVVGTPGRILDVIGRGRMDMSRVATLVLDEADTMLDMGFQEDIEAIMAEVPGTRQTIFFSATFPDAIKSLTKKYLHNPARVVIEDAPETVPMIAQIAYETEPSEKVGTLLRVLQQHEPTSALVFCNLKVTVAELAETLKEGGVSCASLHGDLEQFERDQVMALFRNGSTRVLIATDVAARGLDIKNLDMVVNFDLPYQPEVYVHRIGRTGRAGESGVAVSLISEQDNSKLGEIEQVTGFIIERKTLGFKNQHGLSKNSIHREAPMQTLSISGGRKDKLRPGDILGALTGEAGGLKSENIGKIEIHDRIAYVAVSSEIAATALHRLREGRIKGQKFLIRLLR